MSVAAHLARFQNKQPQLSAAEHAQYERLGKSLSRARAALAREKKRGDAKKIASAERSLANALARRAAFVTPKVEHLACPTRIIAKFDAHWHGSSGTGIHHHECEMILDYKDIAGPNYKTVRVWKDEGAPPTNARGAPDAMGVAWWAIEEQIARGKIVVLDEEQLS